MSYWNWDIENKDYLKNSINRCKQQGIILPKFSELRNPESISKKITSDFDTVNMQDVHPINLFRINWRNEAASGGIGEINYFEIPKEISGVDARIIGLVGKFFPTGAHKVGATYGCLAPYLVTGKFNPEYHKAVWPSTGNYCRGGTFNSVLLSVHPVAILPEEMSKERFDWLKNLGAEIYATPGCESNVKEIYDKCHELEAESDEYFIFNQFDQFGNSVWHYEVTGYTLDSLFNQIKEKNNRLSGFVSATGSAGTIAAGDYLRTVNPLIKVCATEALQCPTLLMNGYGGHRIEGIGDKHIPWIHNVKNTDCVAAINDEDTLDLLRLFNEPTGKEYLLLKGLSEEAVNKLSYLGISSICNLLASIKTAKYYEFTEKDIIFTIFTDSVDLYNSRLDEMNNIRGKYNTTQAAVDYNSSLIMQKTDNFLELSFLDKKRIHNLKYFTWIEQQGKDVEELDAQWYDDNYWEERFSVVTEWDKLIENFNKQVGIQVETV